MDITETVLKDIGIYKNNISPLFLDSQDICELLLGKGYTDENITDLMYTQIFPYLYIDETQTDVLSYLCFEVNIPRIPTANIKDIQIIIWAYCHKDIMKYSKKGYSGSRTDILADMVERVLRDSYDFGIGKLHLDSVGCINPHSKYYGRQLIFTVPDFRVKG